MSYLSFVLLALALVEDAYAFSTGAPLFACSTILPLGHGGGQSPTLSLQYSLSTLQTEFFPNDVVEVTINGDRPFEGIFLQVRENNGNLAVGVWSAPSAPAMYQAISCAGPGSAITHTSNQPKNVGTRFSWQAPPSCTPGSTYNVRGAVVETFLRYQTDLNLVLRCASAPPPPIVTTTLAPPPPVTTTQAPPPPVTTQAPPPRTTTLPPPPPTSSSCIFQPPSSIDPRFSTSFENGLLGGWLNMGDSQWSVGQGETGSYDTGPNRAYMGTNYAYFEASYPAQPNDIAILATDGQIQGCFCLRFANSMNVNNRGHRFEVRANENVAMTLEGPQQGGIWTGRQIQFDTGFPVILSFNAIRGADWMGDTAIDDVQLIPGPCVI